MAVTYTYKNLYNIVMQDDYISVSIHTHVREIYWLFGYNTERLVVKPCLYSNCKIMGKLSFFFYTSELGNLQTVKGYVCITHKKKSYRITECYMFL